ncbi:hypothetical protein [Oxalicibacterium flavum]|nr:hypothetical protein [Oxalicibacterium flavum]
MPAVWVGVLLAAALSLFFGTGLQLLWPPNSRRSSRNCSKAWSA